MPSGNSVAARVLQQLAQLTGEAEMQQALEKQLYFLTGSMAGDPSGHSYAHAYYHECAVSTKDCMRAFLRRYRGRTPGTAGTACMSDGDSPGLAVLVKTEENGKELCELAPYTRDYPVPETGAQFYLCVGSECRQPTAELGEVLRWLGETAADK